MRVFISYSVFNFLVHYNKLSRFAKTLAQRARCCFKWHARNFYANTFFAFSDTFFGRVRSTFWVCVCGFWMISEDNLCLKIAINWCCMKLLSKNCENWQGTRVAARLFTAHQCENEVRQLTLDRGALLLQSISEPIIWRISWNSIVYMLITHEPLKIKRKSNKIPNFHANFTKFCRSSSVQQCTSFSFRVVW